jgi:hypothetical protein
MLHAITDISVTIFVWYMMVEQLYKTIRREIESHQWRKRFRINSQYGKLRRLDRVSPYPETWIGLCPDCGIAWPVQSKDCRTFNGPQRSITGIVE